MDYPVGLVDEMERVIRDETRARRRAAARARRKR